MRKIEKLLKLTILARAFKINEISNLPACLPLFLIPTHTQRFEKKIINYLKNRNDTLFFQHDFKYDETFVLIQNRHSVISLC